MAAGGSFTSTTTASAYPGEDSLYRFVAPPIALGTLASQQQSAAVSQGQTDAGILRVDLPVTGLIGSLTLNSIRFNTQNTDNNDVVASGVKLWTGTSTAPVTQLGSAQSIVGDSVVFSGLTANLPNGNNYLWLTYTLSGTATLGNVVDAQVPAGSLVISSSGGATNPGSLPASAINPSGSRAVDVPMTYSSTTLHQTGNSNITLAYNQNTSNNPIVCVKVKMSSTGSSLPLTALSFTPTGSNNVSTNLQNAKIFFTGS
ncbi:MAG: hypothetical protein HYZ42_14515 [Bacteroidetes bacterium]|nr:hypothetical protein [Bacteroidota bacterium]